jgi:hypothetical protein
MSEVRQVLLIGACARQAEVVDLDVGHQRFEHVPEPMDVADAVARGERVAEQEDAGASIGPRRFELALGPESGRIRANEVAAPFVIDSNAETRNEPEADDGMVLELRHYHRRHSSPPAVPVEFS